MASRIDDFGTPEAYNHYAVGLGARDGHAVPVDQAGRLALGRHAQRHDRALAGRDRGAGRDADAVPPRDRRRADGPRGGGAARSRRSSTACSRFRSRACSMAYSFDDAARDDRHTTQYFEMFVQPRHLPRGLDRGDPAQHPVGRRRRCRALDDDVWELYGPDDWTQAHDLAADHPEQAARAAAALPHRGRSTTCSRSTTAASSASTPTWPAGRSSCAAHSQLLFGGMGRLTENSIVVLKNKSHAITAAGRRARGRGEGVIIAQGGAFGGFAPVPHDGQAGLLLQPLRPAAVQGLRRARPIPAGRAPGADGVRLRRRRARQGRRRPPLRRRRAGRQRARRRRPSRCSSRRTRRPMSAPTPRRR